MNPCLPRISYSDLFLNRFLSTALFSWFLVENSWVKFIDILIYENFEFFSSLFQGKYFSIIYTISLNITFPSESFLIECNKKKMVNGKLIWKVYFEEALENCIKSNIPHYTHHCIRDFLQKAAILSDVQKII